MKKIKLGIIAAGFLCMTSTSFTACKDKAKETTTDNTTTTAPATSPAPAPVVINEDETLRSGVKDATKDYPAVNAEVTNGEITLTGEITRDRLPNLMQSLNSLRPKKINNNLTIK